MTDAVTSSVGVFTTDDALVVRTWDAWMAQATGLSESEVQGRQLAELFPELVERGLLSRLERVASGRGAEVLAPAFHRYLIKCRPRHASQFEEMRQHVTIAPIERGGRVVGVLVTIQDVTARLDRDRERSAGLRSDDESVRLRTAERLASTDISPAALVSALGDDSWRVRRAASHAIATSDQPDAIATLVAVIRERHSDPGMLNAALSGIAEARRAQAVQPIAQLIASGDTDVRIYAALALGMLGDEAGVPALVPMLDDSDANVRYHAIEALGRIGDRRTADILASIAESRDFFVAFAAMEALALIGDASIAPRLMPLLDDPALVPAAAATLGTLATEDAAVPLARALGRDGAPAGSIAVALRDIHDRLDLELEEGALVADLVRTAVKAPTITALLEAIPTAGARERAGIAAVLGWLEDPRINGVLASMLSFDEDVAEVAAIALSRRGSAAAAAIISHAAGAEDDGLRIAAAALGRIGSPAAVPFLISLLAATDEVTIAAAGALARIGDRRSFEPLLDLLESRSGAVRQSAVAALNSVGHRDMEQEMRWRLSSQHAPVREAAARIAGYFGYPTCLDLMLRCTVDSEEVVRRAAVEHLSSYNDDIALDAIRASVVSDASSGVRAAAARSLARSRDSQSLEALLAATSDPHLWVRYYAIRSLGQHEAVDGALTSRLLELARTDPAPPVRISAIRALADLSSPGVGAALAELAAHSESDIAVAAIESAGRTDPVGSAPLLLDIAESDDPRRAVAALDVIDARNGDATRIHGIAERAEDDFVAVAGIRALIRMGTPDALQQVVDLGRQPRLRRSIVESLAGIPEQSLAGLEPSLSHPDERVRALLVDALVRMKKSAAARMIGRLLDDPSPLVRRVAAHALSRAQ